MLGKMVHFYDKDYTKQWDKLPIDFKLKMLKGIVAFEIIVTDLQAKKKLSQNRTPTEKDNIINSLNNSPHANDKQIAVYMAKMRDNS